MFDLLKEHIVLFGGYSAVTIGISSWLGLIIARKISAHRDHKFSTDITKLQNELDLLSHQRKISVSRFDELRASSLQEIHNALVELEMFVEQQLHLIYNKWDDSFSNSQKALEKSHEKAPAFLEDMHNKKIEQESKLALAVGVLEYIGYEAFDKWGPELKKTKLLILKKEVYVDDLLFEKCLNLLKQVEHTLNGSVQSIASVTLEGMKKEGGVDKEVKGKIDNAFSSLANSCKELFRTTRKEITRSIKGTLCPK